jgi:hypothetical protein
MEAKFKEKAEYVHPMVFEDLRERWVRAGQEALTLR